MFWQYQYHFQKWWDSSLFCLFIHLGHVSPREWSYTFVCLILCWSLASLVIFAHRTKLCLTKSNTHTHKHMMSRSPFPLTDPSAQYTWPALPLSKCRNNLRVRCFVREIKLFTVIDCGVQMGDVVRVLNLDTGRELQQWWGRSDWENEAYDLWLFRSAF